MSDPTPRDIDERLRRLLGDVEPGDDELMADPTLRRIAAALEDLGPDPIDAGGQLDAPPPGLWEGIAAGAGLATPVETALPQPPAEGGGSVAPVVPLRRGSSPPWWLGAAAAVLVVLVVAVGALAIVTGDDPDEQQLASAQLDVLVADAAAAGSATLLSPPDSDDLFLQIDASGLDPIDGFYEVWLLTPEVDGLVSLGPLRSDGRYELPPGLDPARFSVVDISIEPHDGDPTHSGNSILRGGLTEA